MFAQLEEIVCVIVAHLVILSQARRNRNRVLLRLPAIGGEMNGAVSCGLIVEFTEEESIQASRVATGDQVGSTIAASK